MCLVSTWTACLPRRGYELEDSETVDLLIEDKYSAFLKNEPTKEEDSEDNLSEKEKDMISEVITHIRKCSVASLPEDLVAQGTPSKCRSNSASAARNETYSS